jgi:hypothetical protein
MLQLFRQMPGSTSGTFTYDIIYRTGETNRQVCVTTVIH